MGSIECDGWLINRDDIILVKNVPCVYRKPQAVVGEGESRKLIG